MFGSYKIDSDALLGCAIAVVAYMVCKLLLLCAPSGRLGKLKRLSFASWHGKNIKACAEAGKYQSITSVSCAFCVSFFVVICVKKV